MTRIVVVSDLHVDTRTAGRARVDEVAAVLEQARRVAREIVADWFLCLGDIYDPGRDDLRWASFLLAEASACAKACARGGIWIAGNHDVVHASSWLTTLSPLAAAGDPRTHVFERPGVLELGPELALLALPYPPAPLETAWRARLDEAMLDAGSRRGTGTRLVVGAHLCVPGAVLESEARELARGRDVVLPVQQLAALDPDLVLNGHYHVPQVVRCGDIDVVIPGSPLQLTFGDAAIPRGLVIVEVE